MKILRRVLACLCPILVLTSSGAFCQEQVDMKALAKTVNDLVRENAELKKRVADLEKQVVEKNAPTEAKPAATAASPKPPQAEVPAKAPAEAQSKTPPEAKTPLNVYWKDGLYLETPDQAFELFVGGRVLADAASISHPKYWQLGGSAIDDSSGTEFREARLELSGSIYKDYIYKLEVDFAGDEVTIEDAYVGMQNVPFFHTIQAGHFIEPFGLEQQAYTTYTTFMERSMTTEALSLDRALGVGFTAPFFDNRLTWAAGVFNRAVDDKPYWDVTTRVTALPWYEDDGRRLLHVGAAFSHQTPNGYISLNSHPEAHLGDLHLDTDSFPAHTVDRWGFEGALVVGPFSLQSEYMAAEANLMPPYQSFTIINLDKYFESTRRFDGYYVQASYFLTGENRPYNTEGAWFDRVKPRNNFTLGLTGWGAWEIALRYSTLNLNDYDLRSGIIGGKGVNWTAGVNWYMTPNTRLMFNYVKAHVDQLEYNGNINIFQGRFQVDF